MKWTMFDRNADFYLASSEQVGFEWRQVRGCWAREWVVDKIGQKFLWITVDPPFIGQPFGLGDKDICDFLISPHYQGMTLEIPLKEYPFPVYMFRILNADILQTLEFTEGDVVMMAWCELYGTPEEAQRTIDRLKK